MSDRIAGQMVAEPLLLKNNNFKVYDSEVPGLGAIMRFTLRCTSRVNRSRCARFIYAGLAAVVAMAVLPCAWGQMKQTTLYTFTGGADGGNPAGPLIFDVSGNLYGAASAGGAGYGVIFKLSPPAGGSGTWTESMLYTFTGGTDGATPNGPLLFDSHGNLYGVALSGGDVSCSGFVGTGCGVIFELTPPVSGSGPWTETPIYTVTNDFADVNPGLVFDSKGNLYNTQSQANTSGDAYELSPPAGGSGAWTFTDVFEFSQNFNTSGAQEPIGGLVIDSQGNLYGAAFAGGIFLSSAEGGNNTYTCTANPLGGCGAVFELSPPPGGSGSWTETDLYDFLSEGDGAFPGVLPDSPEAGVYLLRNAGGNLYGTAQNGGAHNEAVLYQLALSSNGSGAYGESALYNFTGGTDGGSPADPIMGASGNIYGTGSTGGTGNGVIFQLAPPKNGAGAWTENVDYSFTGGDDGGSPSGVVLDSHGNLYGSAAAGGADSAGVIYELSPGFAVTASPASLTVGVGESGEATITTALLGEFNASTTLSASGEPSGVTVSFSPRTFAAPGAGASTMTVHVASSVAAGTYVFSVNGSGGGVTSSATITLTVVNDFTLEASPASITVLPGGVGTFSITTGLLGAFNSAISLSATGQPSGATVSFSPNPIPAPGRGTATMTVMLGSNVTPATYTLTVTATGGGRTHTTTADLEVVNLSLAVAPADVYVTLDNTATATVTASRIGDFDAAVSLSASGLPSGVTASFSPNPIPAPGDGLSTVTFAAASTAATGTYPISIIGTGGGATRTANLSLQVVGSQSSTTTALTSSTNPSSGGQTITFMATVTPAGGRIPTGSVTFRANGIDIGVSSLDLEGVALLRFSGLPAGTYSMTATYNGSATDAASTSATLTQTVTLEPTTATLTTTPNPSSPGQAVTLTCTATAGNGTTPVGGAATFYSDGVYLANVNANAEGVATYSHTFATAGTYDLTCKYDGATRWGPSTSAVFAQTVSTLIATTTTMSGVPVGQGGVPMTTSATVTAVAGPTPTGSVTFCCQSGGGSLGSASLIGGTASVTWIPQGGGGVITMSAVYNGSATDASSTGTMYQPVNCTNGPGYTTMSTAPDPSTTAQDVMATASIPFDGSDTSICFTDLNFGGGGCVDYPVVTFDFGELAAGTHYLVAEYAFCSVSPVVTQVVTAAPARRRAAKMKRR